MLASLKSASAPKLKNALTPMEWSSARSAGRSRGPVSAAILFSAGSSGAAPLPLIALFRPCSSRSNRRSSGCPRRSRCGRLLDAPQRRVVSLLKFLGAAPCRAVRRDRLVLGPAATGELVEVRAGIHAAVQELQVEPNTDADDAGREAVLVWACVTPPRLAARRIRGRRNNV